MTTKTHTAFSFIGMVLISFIRTATWCGGTCPTLPNGVPMSIVFSA